jgi:hypothetical protein
LDLTVKVHPEEMLPPEAGHTGVAPLQRLLEPGGPVDFVSVTEVSPEFQPVPVTVTTVPVGPVFGVNMRDVVVAPTTKVVVAAGKSETSASYTVMR